MKTKSNKGSISILGIIILSLILIVVLSHYHIDIRSEVESEQSQSNLNYVGNKTTSIWEQYLSGPAHYIWNKIFVDLLWGAFVSNFERIRDGKPTDFDMAAPTVQMSNQPTH